MNNDKAAALTKKYAAKLAQNSEKKTQKKINDTIKIINQRIKKAIKNGDNVAYYLPEDNHEKFTNNILDAISRYYVLKGFTLEVTDNRRFKISWKTC